MRWSIGEFRVEEARQRDALAALDLYRRVLGEERWFITRGDEYTFSLEEMGQRVADLCASHNSVFLVARSPKLQVAGMLLVFGGALSRMRHTGKLEILVDHAQRGTGVGRSLLTAGLEWAVANPILEKLGLSVFSDNERALSLYRAFGFEQEGCRKGEYRMEDGAYRDDLLLHRSVSSFEDDPSSASSEDHSASLR
jgi:ribosomal protein S18 acetylase RimI-like enzyme